jgi:hypothetical protein
MAKPMPLLPPVMRARLFDRGALMGVGDYRDSQSLHRETQSDVIASRVLGEAISSCRVADCFGAKPAPGNDRSYDFKKALNCRCFQANLVKFIVEAGFVNGFQQAGSEMAVNLDCRTDDRLGKFVDFFELHNFPYKKST